MNKLLPFLRYFFFAKWFLLIGLFLMFMGLASSIGLLSVSGWFLAATAIAGAGSLFNFFYPSAGVRGLSVSRTAFRYFEKIATHDTTFRILANLRVDIFRKIIPLSSSVLNNYRQSDLLNRLVADVDTLDSLYIRLLAPFSSAILVIGLITLILSFFHVGLALLIGFSLWLLLLIIPTIFYHLGKKSGAGIAKHSSAYRSLFVEFIQAQAELVLCNAVQLWHTKMHKVDTAWNVEQAEQAKLSGLATACAMFANGLLLCAVLYISATADFAHQLAPDNQIYQSAIIALFAFMVLGSFEILLPLGGAFLQIGKIVASAERLDQLINQKTPIEFKGNLEELSLKVNQPIIEFNNISFSYPNQLNQVLSEINFEVLAGQKVAILGKTGSGKSTLLQLLVRNYAYTQGQINLAGNKIEDYSLSGLRQSFVFLSQKVHIFSDTLRNNLQIASHKTISSKAMEEVLNQVGLSHLYQAEQAGLDVWLGDGGRSLSGGEQRRLGLARILLNQATIILLDEPTEGLDSATEKLILDLLWQHSQGKTMLMVTHRLTKIAEFDQIVVIDDGRIAQQGVFAELVKTNGLFKHFYDRV